MSTNQATKKKVVALQNNLDDLPKLSHSGGNVRQPICLDSDASSSSSDWSHLEVLPPPSLPGVATQKKTTTTKTKTTVAASTTSTCHGNDTSESDSDDDSMVNAKLVFKATTSTKKQGKSSVTGNSNRKHNSNHNNSHDKVARQHQQELQRLEKLAEQDRKKAERQAAKERRMAEKDAAKDTQKRCRLEYQQARGTFATSEIVLLVDPPLFRRPTDVEDYYDWTQHEEIVNHNCAVHEYRSAIGGSNCHALQWIRTNHLQGGAAKAWQELRNNNPDGYFHFDRLVIVFDDPKVFLELLRRTEQETTDDDYPQLRQWLLRLEHSWRAAWPNAQSKRPNVLLLLLQATKELDRQLVEYRQCTRTVHDTVPPKHHPRPAIFTMPFLG